MVEPELDHLGILKEPKPEDGLSQPRGRHFSGSKIFRKPRKNQHKCMKKAGKEIGKALKGIGKFAHEVYEEG